MPAQTDPAIQWPQILDALASGNTNAAKQLIWPSGVDENWFHAMGPVMENAARGYEKSNLPLAIFCYEEARSLYAALATGATSAAEAMMLMDEKRDRALERKIQRLRAKTGKL